MKYFWLIIPVLLAILLSGCRPEREENRIEERESIVFNTQPESSSDDLFFTEKQETIYHSPYPPFLEVMDYEFRPDGTITLYADVVWPEKKTDCAFSNVIVVQPLDDGSFRILSNEVEETELVKKLKGKW